ncbi:MAG TPA: hypothetical protein VJG90_00860 [Candidatus Nanoarchaeia archaeon]|nr:hypothetical protein [Candidatus Nanoarchaeia archaeon]
MFKRKPSWERDEYYSDPYDIREEDLEQSGMPVRKAKFIRRFCRAL